MVLTQHLYNNYSSRGRLISLASLRTELFFPISKSRKRDSNIRHLLTCTNERKLYRYNIPNLYTNYFYYTNYCRLSCIGPRQNEIRLISSSTISNNDTDADNNNALNSSSDEASSSSLMNDLRVELYWTCHELISFQNDIGNDLLTSQFEQSKKHYLHKQQQTIMNQQQRHQPPQQPEIQNLKSEHHNNGSILECDIPNQVLHEDYEKDEIVLQELDYEKDVMNPIENNNNYENNINIDTEQNTKFNNSLLDAIILLRLMSKDDWKTFDEISNNSNNVEVEKDVVDDIQVTDEVHVVYDDIIVEEEEDLQTRHNNNEIDATTQSDEILSSLVPICLEQMEMGEMIMSTNDVNVLLAIVALTPDSSVIEESLDLIIEIYQQMIDPGFKNYVKPDAITYEIIILTLHRRLNINTTTVSFIWDELILSKKRNIEWTVELLEIILQVCEDRKSIKLAHHILSQLQPMNDDVKKMEYIKLLGPITKQSFHSLLNVMKASDNAIENVITICKMALRVSINTHTKSGNDIVTDLFLLMNTICFLFCITNFVPVLIKQTRKKRFRSLDSIFIHVLKLPTTTRSKKGQQMLDANDFVKQILNLWDEHRFYSPTYQVWRQFIITASSGSGEYQDKEKLFPVIKAYERLLRRSKKERFYLDSILLKHGIDAATCSNRTDLASTLITKFVDDELYKLNSSSIDNQYHIQIPVFDILKVIDICTNNNDIDSCRIILSNIDRIREHILPSHIRLLCVAGLNTFAKAGAFEIADKLLSYMRENDLKPG